MHWTELVDVYKWADLLGKMMIRVCLFFPMPTWSHVLDIVKTTGRKLSQWIYVGGVKAFANGSFSALFHEPYADERLNNGLQITDVETLYNLTVQSDKSGLQVAIHAIGDKANDLILDMYKSVVSTNGIRDQRFRIEHAQRLTHGSADKFGEQGIVASTQVQVAALDPNGIFSPPAYVLSYFWQNPYVINKISFQNDGTHLLDGTLSI